MNKFFDGPIVLGLCVISIMIGILIGGFVTEDVWQRKVIEHNCGQYNNKTGNFEWVTNVNSK